MKRVLIPIPKPLNIPQRPIPSGSERGFAPAGDAQKGVSVQFTPTGDVTPSGDGDSGSGKAESSE